MENQRKVYRFKLSKEIVEELSYFSRLHEFDSKNDYKDAWKLWIVEKKDEISRESLRLKNMGYEGDIIQKLYVSARYYYKNKKDKPKQEPQKRKQYVSCDEELIICMDDFIEKNMKKPKDAYNLFLEETKDNPILTGQIQYFIEQHGLSKEDIETKLKKTFKNRYFLNNK